MMMKTIRKKELMMKKRKKRRLNSGRLQARREKGERRYKEDVT